MIVFKSTLEIPFICRYQDILGTLYDVYLTYLNYIFLSVILVKTKINIKIRVYRDKFDISMPDKCFIYALDPFKMRSIRFQLTFSTHG